MSEHDVVIRGGTVVDGTGAPRRTADGAVVAPGFMDIHARYRHTFVHAVETYSNGVETGELPGRLIRGSQAVATR
jgi:N-acyl-D-aspartate/D-glutamate deacylase